MSLLDGIVTNSIFLAQYSSKPGANLETSVTPGEEEDVLLACRVETRDAARYPAMHKTAPTAKNYPAQHGSSAHIEKPWLAKAVDLVHSAGELINRQVFLGTTPLPQDSQSGSFWVRPLPNNIPQRFRNRCPLTLALQETALQSGD